ncbi:MAG: NYN domain-containing protein [Bacilli bacterium]
MKVEEILIVDGYNIIGAWSYLRELKMVDLFLARDGLIQMMVDYQSFSGRKVYIVFDAYDVPGKGSVENNNHVEIVFSKENETADEMIERLVNRLTNRWRRIYVATNDLVEQRVIFGQGALRISSKELWREVESNRKRLKGKVTNLATPKNRLSDNLSEELKKFLENWRRQ